MSSSNAGASQGDKPLAVALFVHGASPELEGGTERTVWDLAFGLACAGHRVELVCGSVIWREGGDRDSVPGPEVPGPGSVTVHRLHRGDAHFEHWHKARSEPMRARIEALLDELKPDVAHVHHWLRLSRDLIATCARAGVPAVVSLHDHWTSCLLAHRVRPDEPGTCGRPMGPGACVPCAHRNVQPATPWVEFESEALGLVEHRQELARELGLARAWIAPSRSHGQRVEEWTGVAVPGAGLQVVPPPVTRLPQRRADRNSAAGGSLSVLGLGHLASHKGAHLLSGALARPGAESIRAHWLGGEVDSDYREALARAGRVQLHGAFDIERLHEHPALAEVDLFVSGSLADESYGLVLDEALALGLPALVPDRGALAERAPGLGGVTTYRAGSEEALHGALVALLENRNRLEALRGEVPARESLLRPLEEVVELTVNIYRSAIRSGAPELAPLEWFEARMTLHREQQWDAGLARAASEGEGNA